MTATEAIRWEQDPDGIVVLTLDDPDQAANTMNAAYTAAMDAVLDRLAATDSVTGVVLTSAKKSFFGGGDLNLLISARPEDAEALTEASQRVKGQLRRLETIGVPVVAAINGSALGGGLEITLACHHRIAADLADSRLGLPEVTLGLLPGGGGIVRTVRMLGLQKALTDVLLQGRRRRPREALAIGLVDELVDTVDELIPRAKRWITANPQACVQPWDEPGYRMPGGALTDPSVASVLPAFPANLRKQLAGAPVPAPRAILAAAVEGALVDLDTAFEIESRYLVHLMTGQVAKNMIKAFHFDLRHINSGGSRPAGFETYAVRRLGVVGAGMMGAAIAYVAAKAGIEVVLKDVTPEAAEKGKGYAVRLEEKAVAKGRTTREDSAALLARINTTADSADLGGVDFVVEAVFENQELKRTVFAEIENVVGPDAVLGSNTSSLPITGLAKGVRRPEDFIGVHFFSPVDRMELVELIRGAETSDGTLAKAIDFARQIGKTPIVVNDSRGFFTTRVIGTFIAEGIAAVGDGVEPASVEQASAQAGYPVPPLRLMDELTLTISQKVTAETRAALEAEGKTYTPSPADAVVERLVREFGRGGRSSGAGFYDYDGDGRRTGLWPGLREAFGSGRTAVPLEDLKERMLFVQALEAVRCFDEGVIASVPDANIGSLLGIGFPAWTGGVIQYVNQYPGGPAGFVARARELAASYGPRFEPPASLAGKARSGELLE